MNNTSQFLMPLDNFWPWDTLLTDVYLSAARFNPRLVNEIELVNYGLTLPCHLTKAAPKRRGEFLAGRYCAYQALLQLTGDGAMVKRQADGAPSWPKGCVGTISHSDNWVGALVAYQTDYLALGFDIEQRLGDTQGATLAAYLLTPQERLCLSHLPAAQLAFMVTLIFSLKESLFKALYPLVNKRFYFEDAELISWCSQSKTARLRLLSTLSEEWLQGQEITGHYCCLDGHIMTLIALATPNDKQNL